MTRNPAFLVAGFGDTRMDPALRCIAAHETDAMRPTHVERIAHPAKPQSPSACAWYPGRSAAPNANT